MAYNWLIGATDAHAKNFGIVLAGQDATLSPVYDTASWMPYAIRPERSRFAMKLGEDYQLLKSHPVRAWTSTARSMGFDPSPAVDRVARLAARLPEAFATAVSRIANEAWTGIANHLAESIVAHVEKQRGRLDHGH